MGHVILAEITALSIEERILLVQAIWDSIASEIGTHSPNEEVLRELDLRLNDLDMQPENVVTWERIKANVRSRT
jgi:putative addiction module component (TIGR02574 family)